MQGPAKFFDYSNVLKCIPNVYSDMYNLEVKKSTIPGAGRGVFVKNGYRINNEDIIAEYRGYIIPTGQLDEQLSTEMTWDENGNFTILGDGVAALVNDIIDYRPLTYEEAENFLANDEYPTHPGLEYNSQFEQIGGRIFLKATRDIEPGEEIFTPYGPDYWKSRMNNEGWFKDFDVRTVNGSLTN